MISIEVFKKRLGSLADNYSEKELIKMKEDMEGLADFLIDEYFEKLNKKSKT